MKRKITIIEEKRIKIVGDGWWYCAMSASFPIDAKTYLDEPYQEGKDYTAELAGIRELHKKEQHMCKRPEIQIYWKELERKEESI